MNARSEVALPRRGRKASRSLMLALVLPAFAGCTSGSDLPEPPRATTEEVAPASATLGLRLFVDGEVLEVAEGTATLLARWPESTAPYAPPEETVRGFVGFAPGRSAPLDLWVVSQSRARRVATGVAQRFAISNGRLAYGELESPTGIGSTRLIVLRSSRELASVSIGVRAAPTSFVGARVLFATGDALPTPPSIWDPRSGEIHRVRSAGSAPATSLKHGILNSGDSGCWYAVAWARWTYRTIGPQRCEDQALLSPSGRWIAAIAGHADSGFDGLEQNRLLVLKAGEAVAFRSVPLPRSYQIAWEDEEHVLVLAREAARGRVVYRCDVTRERCARVWTFEAAPDRYAAWLVPKA
jgi:hypothetical protein